MSKADNRIYIGNLPPDVRTKDIEDLFYKYGKIKYIDLKNRRGPPFAFIEFDDQLDAEDAIHGRDGYNFDGYRLRVEIQKGPRNSSAAPRPRSGPPTRRSDYRCIISGLPPTGSWQDLKDHMREAGNVCYADVFKDGTGVVEFIRYDDMKYAVKYLDDTKFRSHEGETSYIRVKSDTKKSGRSSSRSRSRSRSRSSSYSKRNRNRSGERATPSYSPVRRSRSKSYDDNDKRQKRSYTRSRSRSRSRSPRYRSRSRSYTRRRSTSKSRSRSRSANLKNVEALQLKNDLNRSEDEETKTNE